MVPQVDGRGLVQTSHVGQTLVPGENQALKGLFPGEPKKD